MMIRSHSIPNADAADSCWCCCCLFVRSCTLQRGCFDEHPLRVTFEKIDSSFYSYRKLNSLVSVRNLLTLIIYWLKAKWPNIAEPCQYLRNISDYFVAASKRGTFLKLSDLGPLRFNIDGAFKDNCVYVGLGGILCDESGHFVFIWMLQRRIMIHGNQFLQRIMC
ncbi:hypothetical protein V6N11_053982 [Hibiscus sabdariffa]|uniref:Uncharacterized protein n=1 Tax=Hibiscus sabdariffa TaxID=183260 RepID=A0ABR2S3E5_9ROSI